MRRNSDGNEKQINKFRIDGSTLRLPNVDERDSLMYRIESLRMYLDKELGEDTFIKVYKLLKDQGRDDDEAYVQHQLYNALSEEKMGYVQLIHQLIFCEERFSDQM